MHLLECMVNTIGFALSIGQLDAEFLVSLFKMGDSAA